MRWLAILALAACGGGSSIPPRPDRAAFDKLDDEGKCAATAPRGAWCADELLAQTASELSAELGSAVAEDLKQEARSTGEEARKLHMIECVSRKGFADAVLRCWDSPDCKTFVACVTRKPAGAP